MSSFMIHGSLFPERKYQNEHRYALVYQFNNFPLKVHDKYDVNQTYWADEHLIIFYNYDESTPKEKFQEIILNSPNKGILRGEPDGEKSYKRALISFDIVGKFRNKTFCLMETEIFRLDESGKWVSDSGLYEL